MGIRLCPRPPHPLPPPVPGPHYAGAYSRAEGGRRGDRSGRGAAGPPDTGPSGGQTGRSRRRLGRAGLLEPVIFQPALARPIPAGRNGGGGLGQGDDLPGPAPDGEPLGRNCRRRMDRQGRPDLPAVGKSRDFFHGDRRRASTEALAVGGRAGGPGPRRRPAGTRLRWPFLVDVGSPPAGVRWGQERGPPAPRLRRVAPVAARARDA